MIIKIKKYFEERKKRKAIKCIKNLALDFGYDFRNLTDEEIESMVICASTKMAKVGVTVEEASKAVSLVLNKFKGENNNDK